MYYIYVYDDDSISFVLKADTLDFALDLIKIFINTHTTISIKKED